MLRAYDQNKQHIGYIAKYKDLCIESDLASGDKLLSFTYYDRNPKQIRNEYYIETEKDRYVVKDVDLSSDNYPVVQCELDLEDLESYMHEVFSAMESTLTDAARLAIAGTGWTVDTDIEKNRSVAALKVTPLMALQKIRDAWMCEIQFNTKKKIVYFRERFGEDKGVYFTSALNLRKIKCSGETDDFYTRVIPIGKDGLKITGVNDGKDYIENYQYSNKIRTLIWEDTNYEKAEDLKADAEKKLNDLSVPKMSYTAEVIDLSRQNTKYKVLEYALGDTIRLIDEPTGIKEKQRIVKMREYPQTPEKNTCELSNTTLSWEEYQAKLEAAASALENITNSDGTIKGVLVKGVEADGVVGIETVINNSSKVKEISSNLIIIKKDVSSMGDTVASIDGEVSAVKARVGMLESTYIKATEADLKYATIETANILEGKFGSLEGRYAAFENETVENLSAVNTWMDNADIHFATIDLANVNNAWIDNGIIRDGSIGSAAIHDGAIRNAKIADATIESAKIKNINADTIDSGTLRTKRLIITGEDGEDSIVQAINIANGVPEALVNKNKLQVASIEVSDLSAFQAKIAGFDMLNNAIYSGKSSITDPTSGIYLSTSGVGIGDGNLTDKNESPLQVYADGTVKLIGRNSRFEFNTVTGALDMEVSSLKISSKRVVTSDEMDNVRDTIEEVRDEVSTLLRVESSRGTVFKNDQVSTVLSAVIYRGKQRITDSQTLKQVLGDNVYLQWKWQRLDEDSYGVISSSDPRFSDNGFHFELSPDDVDTKITFICELMT